MRANDLFCLFSSPGGEKQRTSQITMEAAASVSPHVVKKRVTKVAPLSPPSLRVTAYYPSKLGLSCLMLLQHRRTNGRRSGWTREATTRICAASSIG